MEARTGIEQALLDQIGKIQKDWDEREARLTKLVEDVISDEKEREERLTKLLRVLSEQVNGLSIELQSAPKLTKHLEQLEKLLADG